MYECADFYNNLYALGRLNTIFQIYENSLNTHVSQGESKRLVPTHLNMYLAVYTYIGRKGLISQMDRGGVKIDVLTTL